ncbi:low-density lipoprotein receptor class A domain-containing protein 2 [Phascolarctos cinereus]|uniref:Low-density lipoprotein receptor class A domain-containing protein 2 isoform X2 n=1 Tax=Phascolarctos cinereus TaxID=38626 RepID=A0A6P5K0U0_PHACI|nr:low-density lipoprotein receptor class A domain-containing protein 2 isoform X2 [Phascolarctos cinereus]
MSCLKPRPPFLGLPPSLLLLGALLPAASALEAVNLVDFCDQMLQGDGMIVRSHPDSRKFYFVAIETDCWLTVQAASPQDRVLFQFRFFLVYSLTQPASSELPQTTTSGLSQPREDLCTSGSYLQFYDGPAKEGPRLGNPLCGLTIPGPVLSTGRSLSLRLVTRGQQPRVDFVGDFTSFRLALLIPGSSISTCGLGFYFLCHNKRCIPQSLVCDTWDIDNCGDGSDQTSHPPASCRAVTMANPTSPVFWMTQGTLNPSSRSGGNGEPKKSWPALQDRSATGQRSPRTLLASLVLLGSGGAVAGLLWWWCCCCPGWTLARTRASKLLPRYSSIYTTCCPLGLPGCLCSGRVTPQGVAAEQVGQAGGQGPTTRALPTALASGGIYLKPSDFPTHNQML